MSRGVPPSSRVAPRGRLFGIAVGAPRETDGDDAVAFRVRDPFGASVASSSSGGSSCGDTPRGDAPRGDCGAPRADDRAAPRETDGDDAVAFGASVASSSSSGGTSCGNAPRGDGGAPRADDGGAPRDDGGAPRDDGGAPRDDGAPPGVKTPML